MTAPLNQQPDAPPPARPLVARPVTTNEDGLSFIMDTARFDQLQRVAVAMCMATLIPKHLKGENSDEGKANCLMVVNQAVRWGMDPWAVAPCSYVVNGRLGFEGKLVAGVVNTKSGMSQKLAVVYNSKKGPQLGAVIYGSSKPIPEEAWALLDSYAEDEDRIALNKLDRLGIKAVRITVEQGQTENKIWKNDPEQKLYYSGVTKWARRHVPELLLGVMTDDDLELIREGAAADARRAALPDGRVRHKAPEKDGVQTAQPIATPPPEPSGPIIDAAPKEKEPVEPRQVTRMPTGTTAVNPLPLDEERPEPGAKKPTVREAIEKIKPMPTKEIVAKFAEVRPEHTRVTVTEKEGKRFVNCACGARFEVASPVPGIVNFPKFADGDGSCAPKPEVAPEPPPQDDGELGEGEVPLYVLKWEERIAAARRFALALVTVDDLVAGFAKATPADQEAWFPNLFDLWLTGTIESIDSIAQSKQLEAKLKTITAALPDPINKSLATIVSKRKLS